MTKEAPYIPNIDIKGDFFGHFFTNNPSPMWVIDAAAQCFMEVNKAAIWLYGYSREEFLAMTAMDIRPREDVAALEDYLSATGPTFTTETKWRHKKKDGTIIWVSISSFAVLYKGVAARIVTATDISKYQEQEKALNQTTKELKEYKNAITTSSIVSITNRRGIIEYANNNFINLTGYSREELIGQSHNMINSGYRPQSFWQEMWNMVLQGNTWRGEVCNRKKSGELYWVDAFIIPVAGEKGRIERFFSISIDITERKNKESEVITLNRQLVAINLELTESKKELEKLSLVAKLTASTVFILNNKQEITWVNDAFIRLTGYTLAEAYGKKPQNLLHGPNSYPHATSFINETIRNKKPFNTEVLHYSKSGDEIILLADGQPVLDDQGNLLQYVIIETDITELKKKQQAIRDSQIKLNAFFSSIGNYHMLVDKQLRVLAFNRPLREFFASVMHTFINEGDYLPNRLAQPLKDIFEGLAGKAMTGEPTIAMQAEIPLPDGGTDYWLVHYMPAYDTDGHIFGVAFSAIDITARKITEDKINRQNALLKEIAWKQSHIVRAPIANILSIASLLEGGVADECLRHALKHETEKLDNIIKDIVEKTIEAKTDCPR